MTAEAHALTSKYVRAGVINLDCEPILRRPVTEAERVDIADSLYRKYGTYRAVAEATGLTAAEVRRLVKLARMKSPRRQR